MVSMVPGQHTITVKEGVCGLEPDDDCVGSRVRVSAEMETVVAAK